MKTLYLLPLAFVMGIEGFDLFAPYLLLLMSGAYAIARLRAVPEPAPAPAIVPSRSSRA